MLLLLLLLLGNLECDDQTRHEFVSAVTALFQGLAPSNPIMFLPWLRHVLRNYFNTLCVPVEKFNKFLATAIDQHMETFHDGNIRDFVDAGLAHILSQKRNSQENVLPFTSELLNISIITFFCFSE